MTEERIPLLVLGLGNVLCGDDGAGVEAVHELLACFDLPDGVHVLDGGTLGLSLLPWLQSAERVILVDAVMSDHAPEGTVVRLQGDDVSSTASSRLSCHQIGVADLLDGARLLGRLPPLALVGIVVTNVELLGAPSPAITARVGALAERVAEEIAALGFEVRRREAAKSPTRTWDAGRVDAGDRM